MPTRYPKCLQDTLFLHNFVYFYLELGHFCFYVFSPIFVRNIRIDLSVIMRRFHIIMRNVIVRSVKPRLCLRKKQGMRVILGILSSKAFGAGTLRQKTSEISLPPQASVSLAICCLLLP